MQCRTSLCRPASVLRLRVCCTGHINAGSTSHGNFSLIKFCSSVLPYLQLHQTVLWAFFGVDEQLDGCTLRPAGLMSPVNKYWNADWWKWHLSRGKRRRVQWIGGWQQLREQSRWFLVVRWRAHGQEVVFTRLSFFHVWTLGGTGDILAWLEPKIFFFFISLWRHTRSVSLSLPARL